jgi:xylulokinase
VVAGIDIGTTSVKAVAVDATGGVVARARVPHRLSVPAAGCLEHDAVAAWVDGPRAALRAVAGAGLVAVAVAALTPSVAAVDGAGRPLGRGVLYDDERGRCAGGLDPTASGEASTLLGWAAGAHPGAAGYWPAQAVANRALGGPGVVDYSSACSSGQLFDGDGWDRAVCAAAGVSAATLPGVRFFGEAIGEVDPRWTGPDLSAGPAPLLAAGGVDAFCEQLVAGADGPGDVLVVCGSTLVVWANRDGWPSVPGLWTLPHLRTGAAVVGGPSNAGGLFLDWVDRLLAPSAGPADPAAVPIWWPYVRGERVPLHEPGRRGALGGIDLTTGTAEVRRAAREASAFVVRHILEMSGTDPGRVVVSGGGCRDRAWLQALADGLGRPVEPVAVPEGAALGAAWLARMGAGLEDGIEAAARWAAPGEPVDPDPAWTAPTAERYARYRAGIAEGGALRVG